MSRPSRPPSKSKEASASLRRKPAPIDEPQQSLGLASRQDQLVITPPRALETNRGFHAFCFRATSTHDTARPCATKPDTSRHVAAIRAVSGQKERPGSGPPARSR